MQQKLREACARAMVQQAAPDMAEVERLVDKFAEAYVGNRDLQRTALLDYVRGILAERDQFRDAAKMVPVEPTPAMLDAGCTEWASSPAGESGEEVVHTIYRAMLAAAPQPVGAAEVPMPGPAAFIVWVGLMDKTPCGSPFISQNTAAEYAAQIKSDTEIRPLVYLHEARAYGDAREAAGYAAGLAAGGKDAERLDWLQEQAEKGCVSMCFDIDGGVHVTLDPVGEDQRAARNVNTVRDGIAALRGEVKP